MWIGRTVSPWHDPKGRVVVHRVVLLAGVLILVTGCGAPAPVSLQPWAQGTTHGPWRSVFTGYGTTGRDSDGTLVVSPKAATGDDTHAALIATTEGYGDVDAHVRMRTTAQLRRPHPNPWEVGWLLWHYTDGDHFYYVTLKPNGWEIGKEDPDFPGHQRFLATGPGTYPLGEWHDIRIHQTGAAFTVWADGAELTTFTDTDPYPHGAVGLYAEDATAEFQIVAIGAG